MTATRYIEGGGLRTVVAPLYVSAPQTPGTYPLIVWSHGGLSTAQNIELVDYWAEQGYITVAPAHLDSVEQRDAGASAGFPTTGNTCSFVNRAADVAMVLDAVAAIETALNNQTGGGYTIDAARPVVGGHSFGAFTAMAVTGAKWVREITGTSISSDTIYNAAVIAGGTVLEERFVGAIYVASAGTEQGYGLYNFNFVDVPFLGINGTADSGPPSNPFPSGYLDRLDVFTSSAGDGIGADDGVNDDGQYMVVFQDAGHTSFLGKVDRYDPDVREITLRFLNGIVKGNTAGLEPLHDPAAYAAARPQINQLLVRPYRGRGPVFAEPFILLPPVGPGGAVNATLAGTADGNGQAVSYAKTSRPDWLVIEPDGTVSGTPAAADEGIHNVTVTAATAGGNATATAQIWVTTPPSDEITPRLAMGAGPSSLHLKMTRLMGGYTYGLETSPNLAADSAASSPNPRIAAVVLSGNGGAGIAPGSTDFNLVNGAIQSGASAVIAITPAESGELVGLNPIGNLADWPVPVLLTGAKNQNLLTASAATGQTAALEMSGAYQDIDAMNVIASIGSGKRLRLVTTPISGWFGCAGERGPGVAIWLALARHVAANPVANTRFIFGAFTGHELDGTGARDFVARHAPRPDEVEAWLALGAGIATYNYDFSGSEPVNTGGLYLGRFLMTNAESFVTPLTGPFAAIPGLTPILTANPIGELGFFASLGYRVWGVGGNSEFHHQPRDLPDVTGPPILEAAGRAFASALSTVGY